MNDDKIFAQIIIDHVDDKSPKIEIEIDCNFAEHKNYNSYKIQNKNLHENNSDFNFPKKQEFKNNYLKEDVFAEIEIESGNNIYKSDSVSKAIKLDIRNDKDLSFNLEKDEKRELFLSMRDIARENNSIYFLNTIFYNKQAQYENSKIFYRQAQFMKDFEDDYDKVIPFSSYFPYYQSMNYEQLRTYFTWRSKIRRGNIENTSVSYAFVYIYELINNIGVESPVDGFNKLVYFWEKFKEFDISIDKYMIKWIKDYYIYYEMPESFKNFILKNNLQSYYPEIAFYEPGNICDFDKLSNLSKYNIKKSAFFIQEKQLVIDCSNFVFNKLKKLLLNSELEFEDLIFQTAKSKSNWIPFEGALFYQHLKQVNRQIVLSDNEIYSFNQNKCLRSVFIARDSGKQLLAYIFKQIEFVLRKLSNYKFNITANLSMINTETLLKLGALGISIQKVVSDTTLEFYLDKNKTVVNIDRTILDKIRIESIQTQEKLSVDDTISNDKLTIKKYEQINIDEVSSQKVINDFEDNKERVFVEKDISSKNDIWFNFKNLLNEIEIKALVIILFESDDIKKFANDNGIMLEVLIDSINEKAFDSIGDNILEIDSSIMVF